MSTFTNCCLVPITINSVFSSCYKVPNKSYALVKINLPPTERSKAGEGKDLYDGFVVLKVDGSIRGAFCPCQGG